MSFSENSFIESCHYWVLEVMLMVYVEADLAVHTNWQYMSLGNLLSPLLVGPPTPLKGGFSISIRWCLPLHMEGVNWDSLHARERRSLVCFIVMQSCNEHIIHGHSLQSDTGIHSRDSCAVVGHFMTVSYHRQYGIVLLELWVLSPCRIHEGIRDMHARLTQSIPFILSFLPFQRLSW